MAVCNADFGLQAAWYAAEAFGKVLRGDNDQQRQAGDATASGSGSSSSSGSSSAPKSISWEECKRGIKQDFEDQYIISGAAVMDVYDPDCEFADPFSSFRGVERFKRNLSNFAKITRDVDLNVTKWEELEGRQLKAWWRFSCILALPWRPRLAAAGQVTYEADPSTGLVVRHLEEWDSDPKEVLKLLLKPSSKSPSTDAERFMAAVSRGDAAAAWQAASGKLVLASLPVVGLSCASVALTGHGLPGTFLGALEGLAWLLLVTAGGTLAYTKVTS